MSKRFGRNQKRKLKATNSHLLRGLQRSQHELNEYRGIVEQARGIIEIVREICPNSIALDAGGIQPDNRCMSYFPTLAPTGLPFDGDVQDLPIESIPLYQLELDLRESEDFNKALHFNVVLDTARERFHATYRITEEGLRTQPIRRIAEELVRCAKGEYTNSSSLN